MSAAPQANERRTELLAIAATLFAERGYAATTVRDIADRAGILSGSLYHHFDSKESMIDAILTRFIEGTLARYEAVLARDEGPREAFEALVRTSFEGMDEDRAAILIYQNEADFLSLQPHFAYLRDADREFERIWTGVLETGVERGVFSERIDPELAYRLVRDAVWLAPRWHRSGAGPKPERIAEQYLAVLVDGVARR